MNAKLNSLLKQIELTGTNNDLMQETIEAVTLLLDGGYFGHQEDIEALEDMNITTGFDLEKALSTGDWYWKDVLKK